VQITNVLSRLSDPTGFGQHREVVDTAVSKAADAVSSAAAAVSSSSSKLKEILTGYDVTDITPKAFSEMLQKLQESGLISSKDLQELSKIRTDLDQQGVASDQSVNLVEMYTKKLQEAEKTAKDQAAATSTASTSTLRRRLDWLQKFAAIHASPDAATINTLA